MPCYFGTNQSVPLPWKCLHENLLGISWTFPFHLMHSVAYYNPLSHMSLPNPAPFKVNSPDLPR